MSRFAASFLLSVAILSANAAFARDAAEMGYELTQKEMKPEEWTAFVKKAKSSYADWANDNSIGNLNRYLNDKLLEVGPGALSGNVKSLKKFAAWVALYKEFDEPVPSYLREAMQTYSRDVDEVMTDFTWEKAAERIKNRKTDLEKLKVKDGKK